MAALYFAREVLIPVTLAMLLSFVLSPLVELLRRVWLGRILSVVLAVVLALGLILALGSAIGTQVAQLSGNLPQYQTTIETKITRLRNATIDKFSEKLGSFGHHLSGSDRAPKPRARSNRRAGPGAAAGASPGGGDPAGPVSARYRQERSGADAVSAGDGRHHFGGDDIRLAAKGGSARPCHPAVRLGRSAPHHSGNGRGRAAAQPLFPDPAWPQRQLWRDRRCRPLFHRRS